MATHDGHRLSRRRFLGAMGASAGAAALNPGGAAATPARAPAAHGQGFLRPEHFGRIFRLPPFAQPSPKVETALRELGRPGGLLDAKDALAAGSKQLIVDLSLSANNPNNPNHTAGTTFFGQFLDHDMTFDADSRLAHPTDPQTARNYRTPSLDLDSLYRAGPVAQQELYDPSDHVKLKLESGGLFEDLPRRADSTAIVGDPRNDENLIIAGLHCAFAAFHNRAVDHVRGEGPSGAADVFEAARRLTTWHYHWLVVTEFLPQIVGQDIVDRVLRRGRRFYTPARGEAFMPVEFQTGTYRMGHSMVRPSYRANLAGDNGQPFFAFIFEPLAGGPARPRRPPRRRPRATPLHRLADLLRLRRRPGQAQQAHRHEDLHGAVSPALGRDRQPRPADRAAAAQPAAAPHVAAALRSERRPRHGRDPLAGADLQELAFLGIGFERRTPLWYCVLKEAEVIADGLHLGPVGGRIVAEVLIGLLQADEGSYLATQPGWRPTLPAKSGTFRMTDFLTFAGVDPQSRGQ